MAPESTTAASSSSLGPRGRGARAFSGLAVSRDTSDCVDVMDSPKLRVCRTAESSNAAVSDTLAHSDGQPKSRRASSVVQFEDSHVVFERYVSHSDDELPDQSPDDSTSRSLSERAKTEPTHSTDLHLSDVIRRSSAVTGSSSAKTMPHTPGSGRRRAGSRVSQAINSFRVSNNLGEHMQEDALVNAKQRTNQKLQMWRVRGAQLPIWEFYEPVSALGGGAFGTVRRWRLKQEVSGQDPHVAVKHIKWSDISGGCLRNKEEEKAVRTELKMLMVLDHPFIIKFREWFEHPCLGIFFVMELCTGRPLQTILEDVCCHDHLEVRLMHTNRLRRYYREVVYAVSYIHSFSPPVVHRDLKPENVLLKDESVHSCVKLIDFGLAVNFAGAGEFSGGMWQQGTPVFMAPETFTCKEGKFTPEMDVWALGVIFFWIATALQKGRLLHPFVLEEDGDGFDVRPVPDLLYAYMNKEDWIREHLEGQPQSAFDLADLILVHESGLRPSAAQVLRSEWAGCGDPAAAASAQVLRNTNLHLNLASYKELTHLDKCILHLVAEKAADADVRHLRRTFRAMDTNGDGRLSMQEIIDGFADNDVEVDPSVLEGLFSSLDDDHSGDITFQEWLAATMGPSLLEREYVVNSAFSFLDSSGNGVLTYLDLEVALGSEEAEDVLSRFSTETQEDDAVLTLTDFRRVVKGMTKKRLRTSATLAFGAGEGSHGCGSLSPAEADLRHFSDR